MSENTETLSVQTLFVDEVYECPECGFQRETSPDPTPKHIHDGLVYTFVLASDLDEKPRPRRGRPPKNAQV